jgi:DNA invertase Pin-like site-specific DNA recombinase
MAQDLGARAVCLMFINVDEERAITIEELAKAGYRYMGIIRTSTSEQKDNLEVQDVDVRKSMTTKGFGKPILMEIANISGAKAARKQIQAILDACAAIPEGRRKVVVVARSVDRLSRDTKDALIIQERLSELGVYLYIINNNLLLNGDGSEQGSNQLVFELLLAVAKNAKRVETIASKRGTKKAKARGVRTGTPQDSYIDMIRSEGTQRGKSVYRRLAESRGALNAGTLTKKGVNRSLPKESGRSFNIKKTRQILELLDDLEAAGGPAKVEEYLQVWDARIKEENKRDVGPIIGKARLNERQRAIHRVSAAYFQDPINNPRPDTVGNPEVATFPSPDRTGTIADASKNPAAYLPKSR